MRQLQVKEATTREKQLVADAEASREAAKKAVAEARAAAPRMPALTENGAAPHGIALCNGWHFLHGVVMSWGLVQLYTTTTMNLQFCNATAVSPLTRPSHVLRVNQKQMSSTGLKANQLEASRTLHPGISC